MDKNTIHDGYSRFFTKLFTSVASLLLIVAVLIISIEMFAVNQGFFDREYEKLDTAQSIGMSDSDLTNVTKTLIEYTTGAADSLDIQAEINGTQEEVFGQREKDHMVDVKALYLSARDVRTYSLVVAVILIALAFIIRRKRTVQSLCRSFLSVSGAFILVVAAIGIYAVVDFSSFWTSFHHLFFDNDLWLLDPRTDVLIMMVPEQFFSDLVVRIIIRFVSIFAVLNVAAIVGARMYKKRENIEKKIQG